MTHFGFYKYVIHKTWLEKDICLNSKLYSIRFSLLYLEKDASYIVMLYLWDMQRSLSLIMQELCFIWKIVQSCISSARHCQ